MSDDFSDLRHRQDRLEGRVAQLESKVELEAVCEPTWTKNWAPYR
jgi:hypothetical protein